MVIITTPNFLKALDTLNNLGPIGPKTITESQLRPLTNLECSKDFKESNFGLSKSYINRNIKALDTLDNLVPIGTIPTNENQTI